jgi:hypothetical protein
MTATAPGADGVTIGFGAVEATVLPATVLPSTEQAGTG